MLGDNIQEEIKRLRAKLEKLEELAYFAAKYQLDAEPKATVYCDGIDINRPTREEAKAIRAKLPKGLKWRKELCGDQSTLNYSTVVEGVTIRLWSTPPPPSCKIVYEEILIPARTERIPKLVCKETETEPKEENE